MKQSNNNMIVALSLVCKYLSNENKNHTRVEIISIGCVLPLLADNATIRVLMERTHGLSNE